MRPPAAFWIWFDVIGLAVFLHFLILSELEIDTVFDVSDGGAMLGVIMFSARVGRRWRKARA